MTREEFIQPFAAMCEIYDKQASESFIEVYYTILQNLSASEWSEAVKNMLTARVYPSFPKPAEILQAIQGTSDERAMLAFHKVLKCMNPYETVRFDDPTIHAVIEHLGGWDTFCNTEQDLTFLQRDFCSAYRSLERSVHAGLLDTPLQLTGTHDNHNRRTGRSDLVREPKQITTALGPKLLEAMKDKKS